MSEMTEKAAVRFRPMTLADLDQVVAIDRVSFPTPWPRDAFLYELKRQRHSICWVAEVDDPDGSRSVAGSIVIWLIMDESHIGTLAVRPSHRGQKIAQKLLAWSLLACYDKGVRQALLEVRESNQAAQKLYRKFGFEAVGLRKNYYKDTHEDAVLMTLAKLDQDELARLAEGG